MVSQAPRCQPLGSCLQPGEGRVGTCHQCLAVQGRDSLWSRPMPAASPCPATPPPARHTGPMPCAVLLPLLIPPTSPHTPCKCLLGPRSLLGPQPLSYPHPPLPPPLPASSCLNAHPGLTQGASWRGWGGGRTLHKHQRYSVSHPPSGPLRCRPCGYLDTHCFCLSFLA